MLFNKYSNCPIEKKFKKQCDENPPVLLWCSRVEKGPTMWGVCWYPTQVNNFDRTLMGWKKHSKAVRCQSEGWQCLAEIMSVVFFWLLLKPTRLNSTSQSNRAVCCTRQQPEDAVMYGPWTLALQTACLSPGSETSSTPMLTMMPLTLPDVCPSAPFSAASWGCWTSIFIAHCPSSVLRIRADVW